MNVLACGFCGNFLAILILNCCMSIILFSAASTNSANIPSVSQKELFALQAFYDATDGPDWIIKHGTPWNFTDIYSQNPCANPIWYGITCTSNSTSSFIFSIQLSKSNLFGEIPSTINDLTQLIVFDLSNNIVSGTIPSTLVDLSLLQTLDLSNNILSGEIPYDINKMTQLTIFSLTNNYFDGNIPNNLNTSTNLTQLLLGANFFTGTIPESLSQLVYLTNIDFSGNRFLGSLPKDFGKLVSLQTLNVQNNNISNTLPVELSNCVQLKSLNVANNKFNGTIPKVYANWSLIQYFSMGTNKLSGTFPTFLTTLNQLIALNLESNLLTGTLPEQIISLTNLTSFSIANNKINGTIPSKLNKLNKLVSLTLNYNRFNGTIPSDIGSIKLLKALALNVNELTGTIPPTLGKLTHLTSLYLSYNLLNGTMPAQLGNMSSILTLEIEYNKLTGTIPPTLCKLTKLTVLMMNNNLVYGGIPQNIGNLNKLQYLFLQYNKLTNSLPNSICNLHKLYVSYFNENYLSGSIPDCINSLTAMSYLNFGSNLLTGSLPTTLSSLELLVFFAAQNNQLTGPLPDNIGNLKALETIQLQNNQLSGTVPSSLSNLKFLYGLALFSNYFYGSLPLLTKSKNRIESLDLILNYFSGSVPNSYSQYKLLTNLFLESNMLSGSVTSVFNATIQYKLSYVSLTYNQLTGQIPAELFKIPTLQGVELISNCISGTIPIEICSATQLTTLLFDGLSASPSCHSKIFPNIAESTSYYLTKHLTGHIPSCLYSTPALQTLHLSGNSITGSIASDIQITTTLTNLDLSHNQLTGTIPTQIQQRQWTNIDLSFNKLSGSLLKSFGTGVNNNNTVAFQVNRLSGTIPETLTHAENINLINGNMFSCGISNRNALPSRDSATDNYQCGSNTYDLSMYLYAGIITVLLGCTTLLFLSRQYTSTFDWFTEQYEVTILWYQSALNIVAKGSSTGEYILLLAQFRRIIAIITVIMLFILVPTYIALTTYYSTYEYSYAWTVSAALLSGETAGIILFTFWLVIVLALLVLVYMWGILGADQNDIATVTKMSNQSKAVLAFSLAGVAVFNFITVIGLNVFYIWVTLNADSQALITLTEVFLAMFKLVWNDLIVPRLFIYARATDHLNLMQVRVAILLFNNIFAPCAATAVISPNCFYYVITNAQLVASTTNIQACAVISNGGVCTVFQTISFDYSYLPPYIYSFQCSSTLVTNYSSIFVYMYLIDAFVKPVYLAALRYAYVHWSVFRVIGDVLLHSIIKPMDAANLNVPNKPLVNKHMVVLTMINTCAILLTFGVTFPLLSVVILVDVVVVTFTTQLTIGRIIANNSNNKEQSQLRQQYNAVLDKECDGIVPLLRSSMWVVVPISAVFYSFFLFDTMGDAVGWRDAMWAPLIIIAIPVVTLFLMFVLTSYNGYLLCCYSSRGEFKTRESEMVPIDVEGNCGIVMNPLGDVAV